MENSTTLTTAKALRRKALQAINIRSPPVSTTKSVGIPFLFLLHIRIEPTRSRKVPQLECFKTWRNYLVGTWKCLQICQEVQTPLWRCIYAFSSYFAYLSWRFKFIWISDIWWLEMARIVGISSRKRIECNLHAWLNLSWALLHVDGSQIRYPPNNSSKSWSIPIEALCDFWLGQYECEVKIKKVYQHFS